MTIISGESCDDISVLSKERGEKIEGAAEIKVGVKPISIRSIVLPIESCGLALCPVVLGDTGLYAAYCN